MPDIPRQATEKPAGEAGRRQVQPSSAGRATQPAAYWDVPGMHSLKFERNTLNGRFRAMCSCGWFRSGPGEEESAIRVAASSHDLEWVDALNAERVQP